MLSFRLWKGAIAMLPPSLEGLIVVSTALQRYIRGARGIRHAPCLHDYGLHAPFAPCSTLPSSTQTVSIHCISRFVAPPILRMKCAPRTA
jgi:hypothetical protein